jgi:DNA replication and repair protein RecF
VWIREIRLTDFRSYEHAVVRLEPGVTTFVGANGQGKTNLVEAVGYAATLGSHRVATDAPLVRTRAERAVIGIVAVKDGREAQIELEINPGKANRARLNRSSSVRPKDVLGIVHSVLFAPEDLALVKGDPSERRRFLDDLLIQRSPRILGVKSDYERILKQRNALLKSSGVARRTSLSDVERTLEVWDAQLIDVGAEIVTSRILLIDDLQPLAIAAYARISDASPADGLALTYVSGAAAGPELPRDRGEWRDLLQASLTARRKDELDRGLTLVGPHRDDVLLSLGPGPAKGYASHGECWSIALSLRLASLDVMRFDGDDPVLILDDVFAELDTSRRRQLTEQVAGTTQVLITAAVPQDVPEEIGGCQIRVTKGVIEDD